MLTLVPRILMSTHVPPGPAIKAAFLHMRNVVGDQVVTQAVALIDRRPQFASLWIDCESHRVANPGGVDAHTGAVRIKFKNVSPVLFVGGCIGVVDVRSRSDANPHLVAVGRELDVACPMALAAGQVDQMRGWSAGFEIAALIREAHHGIGVSGINPLRIIAGRIEVNAEDAVQTRGENGHLFCFAVSGSSTENLDHARITFGHEDVTVGSRTNQPRTVEIGCIQLDLKSRRNLGPRVLRTWHYLRTITGGRGSVGRGQIGDGDLANCSWLLKPVVGEGSGWCWSISGVNGGRSRRGGGRGVCRSCGVSQRFHESDDLPTLGLGEAGPGRHSIIDVTLGDVPENLTV